MIKHFGQEWLYPEKLHIYPHFILEKLSIAEKCRVDVKLKQEFFKAVKILQAQDKLHGYFMFDFNFTFIVYDAPLEFQIAFVSKDVIKVIELEDCKDNIEDTEIRLKERIETLKYLSDSNIPVEGVVVFPFKFRPSSLASEAYTTLYIKEQITEFASELETELKTLHHSYQLSSEATFDTKGTIARLIYYAISIQSYATSAEGAMYEVAMWLFSEYDDEDITEFTRMPYNSINLTMAQKALKDDLVASNVPCTILSGAYGIGKSVVIVNAIKELIKKTGKLKILFMSAQSFLDNAELKFSPFLLMIEQWFEELFEPKQKLIKIVTHTENLKLAINSLEMKFGNEDVTFFTYLLKEGDIDMLCSDSLSLNIFEKFDIIVLEETHTLSLSKMEKIIIRFNHLKKSKLWISSNSKSLEPPSCCKVLPKESCEELKNWRNTPEITTLAEEMESVLIPERYPSIPMSVPCSSSGLSVDCMYEIDDKERVTKIVERAERWQWLPRSDLLFIDCENSNLFQELHNKGIPVYQYNESKAFQADKFLFLQRNDPVESITAGAEWPVFIIHVKRKTLNESDAVTVFSKRIISRVTTKLYLFSDRKWSSGIEKDKSKDAFMGGNTSINAETLTNSSVEASHEEVIHSWINNREKKSKKYLGDINHEEEQYPDNVNHGNTQIHEKVDDSKSLKESMVIQDLEEVDTNKDHVENAVGKLLGKEVLAALLET